MRRRRVEIRLDGRRCGVLEECEEGARFVYDAEYLASPEAVPVSLTMPLRAEPYAHPRLHPFFENLLPEGWLLDIATTKLKVQVDDAFGLLAATCRDCMGAVEVWPLEQEEEA